MVKNIRKPPKDAVSGYLMDLVRLVDFFEIEADRIAIRSALIEAIADESERLVGDEFVLAAIQIEITKDIALVAECAKA